MSQPEEHFDMVVPFVCVESQGGPYADEAFVAGVQYGELREALSRRPLSSWVTIKTSLSAQCELLAMEFGYEVSMQGDDEWTAALFKRVQPTVGSR